LFRLLITPHADASAEAATEFFNDLAASGLRAPVSYLAVDTTDNNWQLVGVCLNEIDLVTPGHKFSECDVPGNPD
jgi:hypothetical protein